MMPPDFDGRFIPASTHAMLPLLNVLGSETRVLLSGDETQHSFDLAMLAYPPGGGVPPHFHEREDELFQVVQGRFEFQVGSETHVAGPGDLAYLPRRVPHALKCLGEETGKLLMLTTPAGILRMFAELSLLPPSDPPDMERVTGICANYGVSFVQDSAGRS